MLKGANNSELYRAYLEKVRTESARTAYVYFIGWSATLTEYVCFPSGHGDICDFRFYRGRSWDFAFIPNHQWLLFYFRKPCQKIAKYEPSSIIRGIPSAKINPAGEVTVRVDSQALAMAVVRYIEK
jgi:hypothetical protein